MDAGIIRRSSQRFFLAIGLAALVTSVADAGDKRTQNFVVFAPSQQLAEQVGEAAERFRNDLAVYWLGKPLPPWPRPCPIRVVAGPNLAAQGVTTYNPAPVRDFQMEVIGTPQRILDSVLPHEVTHTVLATYFGRPLPRWADEGICTTVEHSSERNKHEAKLREFLRTRRGIAMNRLFLLTEYPNDVLPMYAQGYSVCRFLIDQKGPRNFIQFLEDYMRRPSWTLNVKKHYDYESLAELQEYWLAWVAAGSGPVGQFAKATPPNLQLADASGVAVTPSRGAAVTPASLALAGPAKRSPQPASPRTPTTGSNSTPPNATPPNATGSAADPGTALASVLTDGWYQRRRLEATRNQPLQPSGATQLPTSQLPVTPIAPPSVTSSGPYQTAHPQPEQRISRNEWSGR